MESTVGKLVERKRALKVRGAKEAGRVEQAG
jgi:hypothetical protein